MSTRFPPGPKGDFLTGCLREARRDPLGFLAKVSAEFGDIAHFRLAMFHVFLLNHPDDVERVLVTHHDRFEKGRTLSGARLLFGNGLLTSDGPLHQRQRRLIQPAFRRMRLADYGRMMTSLAIRQQECWHDGHPIDIAGEMGRLTLAVAGRMLFSTDAETLLVDVSELLSAVDDLLEVAVLPLAPVTDLLPLPRVRRLRRTRAKLDRLLEGLIVRRRRDRIDRGDLLTLLMGHPDETPGEPMSDVHLRDELVTLLLAGHDTTANALAWSWYLVARHPEIEARLQTEIDAVAGARPPDIEDVPALSFTRAVFAESMRLFPPAWLLGRVATADHDARGYVIPSGSIVVLSPWAMHRNRAYFPEPERFDPDRWLGDEHRLLPRFAFFPFGGGPRGCMGEALAWIEGVLLIAAIAQRWRFRLLDRSASPEVFPGLTLKPKGAITVVPERRS